MGGFFGVVSQDDCVQDLFYGTDYHSHLGTVRGGMAVKNSDEFQRYIHDITTSQFRSKFEDNMTKMMGKKGIGVISDFEDQPLLVGSHLGVYAIVTVGVIKNIEELTKQAFNKKTIHFSEMSGGEINPTEVVATLINQESTYEDGIQNAQEKIEGSCSMLLLTEKGIYAARDRLGRTPVIIGQKEGSYAAAMETSAFPNLNYSIAQYLGPSEIVFMSDEGIEQKKPPSEKMQICSFLWIYYGYPSSNYEGINVEIARNRCGAYLARKDTARPDIVAGIPDSGVGHAIGYATEAGIPYRRPFVKYTPTWPRSFIPQDQAIRNLVAVMKLIPIEEIIDGASLLFCEDSIVRGTQLKDTIERLYDYGAKEIHMRPSCPPLVYSCKFLNFSRSRSALDLAARKAINEIEGSSDKFLDVYADHSTKKYAAMLERIQQRLHLTSLRYQILDDMVDAIGLPKERLCTYCWDGCEG